MAAPRAIKEVEKWASTSPSISARSLLLTISPIPRSMASRISILKALNSQGGFSGTYGTVEHFRNLRHHPTKPDPGLYHAIVSSGEMAERLLKSSPLAIDRSGNVRAGYIDEAGLEGGMPHSRDGFEDEQTPGESYTIQIAHSYHVPEVSIKSSPLYSNWRPIRGSPISEALKQRVPEGISKEGVCDWGRDSPRERRAWFTGEGAGESMPWRIARRLKEEQDAGKGMRRVGLRTNS